MTIKDRQFLEYIAAKKEECTDQEKVLRADSRQDEANLYKVRYNVYDIFGILYQGAKTMMEKRAFASEEDKMQAIYDEFQARGQRIPAGWHANLEKARKFQATDKAVIEEIKLGIVDEIMEYFEECCA